MENKEKQNLETIIQPYDQNETNKHQATRIKDESNSLIDYIIIDGNEPLRYSENFYSPIQTDHFAQLIILATKISKNKLIKKQIYDKTNNSLKDFKHSIKQLNWENFYCSTVPSEMLRTFERKLEQQILLHAPIKKFFINKSQFSLAKRFISKNNRNKNLLREQYLNSESFHEFFKLKAEVCAGYEKDFEKFHNQLIESSTSERKKGNLINEVRNSVKTTTTVYSLKNSINEIITEKTKIANLLDLKFSKLEFFESRNYTVDLPMVRQKTPFLLDVTKFECLKTLLALGKFKPLGPSTIPSRALRDAASELAGPICFLLNEFIKTETFPAELKRADITPLVRKGDLDDPLNYRPISLTPALAKVFESLIKQQIDEYVHKNALLSQTQFGLRKKISTTDALAYLTEKYNDNKNEKQLLQQHF